MTIVAVAAGPGRSGSTLVGESIGSVLDVPFLGEVSKFWDRLVDEQFCNCGTAIRACPLWSLVIEAIDLEDVDVDRVRRELRELNSILRLRLMPSLPHDSELARAQDLLFTALDQICPRGYVDTSKATPHLIGRSRQATSARYVLLVREPRAVAYSWARKGKQLRSGRQMRTWPPTITASIWVRRTAQHRRIGQRFGDRHLLRYEDFCRNPVLELSRLTNRQQRSLDLVGGATFTPTTSAHALAGNPSRYGGSTTRIAIDEEWRSRMPWHTRRAIQAITWLERQRIARFASQIPLAT